MFDAAVGGRCRGESVTRWLSAGRVEVAEMLHQNSELTGPYSSFRPSCSSRNHTTQKTSSLVALPSMSRTGRHCGNH